MTLLVILAMAGLAQWWADDVIRLGGVALLWGAGLAVVGGHMAGRADAGLFALVVSTGSSLPGAYGAFLDKHVLRIRIRALAASSFWSMLL